MTQPHQSQVHSPKQAALAGPSWLPGGTLTEAKSKIKETLKAPQPRGWQEGEDELCDVLGKHIRSREKIWSSAQSAPLSIRDGESSRLMWTVTRKNCYSSKRLPH